MKQEKENFERLEKQRENVRVRRASKAFTLFIPWSLAKGS
jgi:hypothetical protein